jgi:hypothetical protein
VIRGVQSVTSGKAGGLSEVERLKAAALRTIVPASSCNITSSLVDCLTLWPFDTLADSMLHIIWTPLLLALTALARQGRPGKVQ